MDWCIRRGFDGVVTDNLLEYLEMCKTFKEERKPRWSVKQVIAFAYLNMWVFFFGVTFLQRHGTCIERRTEDDKKK